MEKLLKIKRLFTTESAYQHSFSPSATGKYCIALVASGAMDPDQAIRQAAIEHGQEQAEEFAAACRVTLDGKRAKTVRQWLKIAHKALAAVTR